jgi:hypothetical protein
MVDMLTARADRGAPLTWIEIGSVAGPEAAIPSAALRSARLRIVGSGIGSVPGRDFVKELPKLASAVADGASDVRARAVPLAEVEQAWTDPAGRSDRTVLVPVASDPAFRGRDKAFGQRAAAFACQRTCRRGTSTFPTFMHWSSLWRVSRVS